MNEFPYLLEIDTTKFKISYDEIKSNMLISLSHRDKDDSRSTYLVTNVINGIGKLSLVSNLADNAYTTISYLDKTIYYVEDLFEILKELEAEEDKLLHPTRPKWENYFMEITRLVATRSTCKRRQVGAILVKNKRIISTGYNGAPKGSAHCEDVGCLREELRIPSGERHELCRAVHAEQNTIIQAASHGSSIYGSTLYCTTQPCSICAKMLINAGIVEIVIDDDYADSEALKLLASANIKVTYHNRKGND